MVKAEDNGGLYGMIEACWLKLSENNPADPIKVNMLVKTISQEDAAIVRPEVIRVGQSITFFSVCQRCSM